MGQGEARGLPRGCVGSTGNGGREGRQDREDGLIQGWG